MTDINNLIKHKNLIISPILTPENSTSKPLISLLLTCHRYTIIAVA